MDGDDEATDYIVDLADAGAPPETGGEPIAQCAGQEVAWDQTPRRRTYSAIRVERASTERCPRTRGETGRRVYHLTPAPSDTGRVPDEQTTRSPGITAPIAASLNG